MGPTEAAEALSQSGKPQPDPLPQYPIGHRVRCSYCGAEYMWMQTSWYSDVPPLYCRAHKAWQSRCPQSRKARYADEVAALSAAALLARSTGKAWRPYECECSGWHLTTQRKRGE